jgi:hypothetical protein
MVLNVSDGEGDSSFISLNAPALGIDDAGQVLLSEGGGASLPSSNFGLYSNGTYTNGISVPTTQFFGTVTMFATAISDAGVVGYCEGPGFVAGTEGPGSMPVSFLYSGGKFTFFPTSGSGSQGLDANAVTNQGQVKGSPDAPWRCWPSRGHQRLRPGRR